MRPSGRLIIGQQGGNAVAVPVDETAAENSAAHSYEPALATGRRFNTLAKMADSDLALLDTLTRAEAVDLLDRPADERARTLGDMRAAMARAAEAKTTEPAKPAELKKGSAP